MEQIYCLMQVEKTNQAVETKDKAEWSIRNERNIPLSEGFEICFCLIVSEREKEKRA